MPSPFRGANSCAPSVERGLRWKCLEWKCFVIRYRVKRELWRCSGTGAVEMDFCQEMQSNAEYSYQLIDEDPHCGWSLHDVISGRFELWPRAPRQLDCLWNRKSRRYSVVPLVGVAWNYRASDSFLSIIIWHVSGLPIDDYLLKMEIMYVSQVRSYQDMHNSNVWSGLRISGCLRLFFKEASLLHCASYCMVHILFIEKISWAYHTVQRKISCICKSWGLTNPVRIQECLND